MEATNYHTVPHIDIPTSITEYSISGLIKALRISSGEKLLLNTIFKENQRKGFAFNSEPMMILFQSLTYLGLEYLRTEELNLSSIDCSTLTSQSYWEGAAISIPFTADRQRSSSDGVVIPLSDIQPADIVVKFPDLDSSPDKTYNHVGLILGSDENNETYVIESNSKEGCVISSLKKFGPNGGFRRYVLNENVLFHPKHSAYIKDISSRVPKLARLGAMQYNINPSASRMKHKGIDIYLDEGEPIYAPIDGDVEIIEFESTVAMVLSNKATGLNVLLGNICPYAGIKSKIKQNTLVGSLISNNHSVINYTALQNSQTHLHFETFGDLKTNFKLNYFDSNSCHYYNPLYLAKLNIVNLPI